MTPEAQLILAQAVAGVLGMVTTLGLSWGAYQWGSRNRNGKGHDDDNDNAQE